MMSTADQIKFWVLAGRLDELHEYRSSLLDLIDRLSEEWRYTYEELGRTPWWRVVKANRLFRRLDENATWREQILADFRSYQSEADQLIAKQQELVERMREEAL